MVIMYFASGIYGALITAVFLQPMIGLSNALLASPLGGLACNLVVAVTAYLMTE